MMNPNDTHTSSGILLFEHYPYRINRTHVPKFTVSAKLDPEWFNLYKMELEALWGDAKDWQFTKHK